VRILVLSFFMPYWENKGGISALIYSLLKYRPQDISLKLYSFNANGLTTGEIQNVETKLGLPVNVLGLPKWFLFLRRLKFYRKIELFFSKALPCYIRIPKCVKMDIQKNDYDYVWIYPYFFFPLAREFPKQKFIVTGCDSNYMLNTRIKELNNKRSFFSRLSLNRNLKKSRCVEKMFVSPNIFVHFVGRNDLYFYEKHTCARNAFYSVHPHYMAKDKKIIFGGDKVKILLAGSNDRYMKEGAGLLLGEMLKGKEKLKEKIQMTFLGRGWGEFVRMFRDAGFETEKKEWVENYVDEILNYDVQIAPISLGTGTKGKILDAMANGLLVIGTYYALENICEDGDGAILYNSPNEVICILDDIYHNRKKYEIIAENGRTRVRREHNGAVASASFFEHFRGE